MEVATNIHDEDVFSVVCRDGDDYIEVFYCTDNDAEKWTTHDDSAFGTLWAISVRNGVSTSYAMHLEICKAARSVAHLQD